MSASDWRARLICRSCKYHEPISSPLGAWSSGWRDIDWDEKQGTCWKCDRTARVRSMEAPHELGCDADVPQVQVRR
jgi:hypothetical protein